MSESEKSFVPQVGYGIAEVKQLLKCTSQVKSLIGKGVITDKNIEDSIAISNLRKAEQAVEKSLELSRLRYFVPFVTQITIGIETSRIEIPCPETGELGIGIVSCDCREGSESACVELRFYRSEQDAKRYFGYMCRIEFTVPVSQVIFPEPMPEAQPEPVASV